MDVMGKQLLRLQFLLFLGLVSCVDDTYDLDKNIDLNVTVGGENLVIPSSETKVITLEKVLGLEEGSSIRTDTYGNYVLVEKGNEASTDITIDRVTIGAEEVDFNPGETLLDFQESAAGEWEAEICDTAFFSIEKTDVTKDIVKLYAADMDMPCLLVMEIAGKGELTLKKGFRLVFPEYLTIASADTRATVDKNALVFNQDVPVADWNPLTVQMYITHVDFKAMDEGQGLVAPGHLVVSDEVVFTGTGVVAEQSPENMLLKTDMKVDDITLTTITAVIDPEIDVEIHSVRIDNLPEVLKGDDVRINLTDPKIFLTVSNLSPADVNFQGILKSYRQGVETATVPIGDDHGAVMLPGGVRDYVICLHRKGGDVDGADESVMVPGLSKLVEIVPDEIGIQGVDIKVWNEPYVLTLGESYRISSSYEINAALQFDAGTQIVYTDFLGNWNGDVAKLSVARLVVSLEAVSTVPMDMEITAEAVDVEGNVIDGIGVAVSGNIKAGGGTIDNKVVTPLEIVLTAADKEDFKRWNGLKYRIKVLSTEESAGKVMNKEQFLKLENISVGVKGGVDVDLN